MLSLQKNLEPRVRTMECVLSKAGVRAAREADLGRMPREGVHSRAFWAWRAGRDHGQVHRAGEELWLRHSLYIVSAREYHMFSENRDWEQTNLIICLPCSVTFNGSHCIPNKPCKHYLDIHSSAQPIPIFILNPRPHPSPCINFMLGLNWSIFHSTNFDFCQSSSPVSPFPPNLLDKILLMLQVLSQVTPP